MTPFSIIIPWKSSSEQRIQNFNRLLNCLDTQTYKDFELIIVEQQTPTSLISDIKSTIILKTDHENFNKSWCINVGARKAKYQQLLIVDADSLFDRDFLENINKYMISNHFPIFLCWDTIVAEAGRDNPNERRVPSKNLRTLGGVWTVDKDFFFKDFGGMNESFFGYGGEDNGAYERACFLLGLSLVPTMTYILRHQYHDWAKPNETAEKYYLIERHNPKTIINALKQIYVGNEAHPTPINMEKF
jgi:glycosyltransferase involved in cell wall biosynthesis